MPQRVRVVVAREGRTLKGLYKQRERFFATTLIMLAFLTLGLLRIPASVHAANGQLGVQQVTLNPGGGILADGTDGLRFTVNSDQNTNWSSYDMTYAPGQDGVVYRGTFQYCCSAGAPMLNIGGALYGQAGPAYDNSQGTWTSIDIVSTAGSTVTGSRTSATGNASASIRYTVDRGGGLTYVVNRTLTYVYPNDYVTDSYSFTIPQGNTDEVKFYLGGDTAPGSSDSGYGVMTTEPVRSVISLNTSSEIMFGFREVAGSRPFDGATSQGFSAPYGTVQSGGDIGYVGAAYTHDAGLMMQWNLGSIPGTYTGSLQQFATKQGTNLNAVFSSSSTNVNTPVNLEVSIVNTELSTVSSLGYQLALPSGLVIDSGSQTNSCGGTVTASSGTNSISLSGGSVDGASNCVVSIPVVAETAGTYAISASSFSDITSLTNNVGASTLTVSNPELGDDLNGDNIEDSSQSNVYSYTSTTTGKTVVLELDPACSVSSAQSVAEADNEAEDSDYEYINGLMHFTANCGSAGYTTTVKQYYYDVVNLDLTLRKFNPNTNIYSTIDDANILQTTINGRTVTTASYQVTDGGELDMDQTENGIIVDPAGLASVPSEVATQASTIGLAGTGENTTVFAMVATAIALSGITLLAMPVKTKKQR